MSKGERLRKLREEHLMSQVEAAEKIGVSKQTLYKYEKDIITNIPSDVVEKIALVYNTTPSYIFGWKGNKEEKNFTSQIADIYVKNQHDRELLNMYHNVSPEIRQMVDYLLKSGLPSSEVPHLKNDKD